MKPLLQKTADDAAIQAAIPSKYSASVFSNGGSSGGVGSSPSSGSKKAKAGSKQNKVPGALGLAGAAIPALGAGAPAGGVNGVGMPEPSTARPTGSKYADSDVIAHIHQRLATKQTVSQTYLMRVLQMGQQRAKRLLEHAMQIPPANLNTAAIAVAGKCTFHQTVARDCHSTSTC